MVSRGQKRSVGFDRVNVRGWQRRHNRRAVLVGSGLLLLSALLWLVNFWVIKFFIFVILLCNNMA